MPRLVDFLSKITGKNQLVGSIPLGRDTENRIRTLVQTLSHLAGARTATKVSRPQLRRVAKKSRKRIIRYGLFMANFALLAVVLGFVAYNPSSGQSIRQNALVGDSADAGNPIDQLSSSDIAVHLSQMASLPETTAVINQADTITNQLAISSSDNQVVAKPQIVSTTAKSHRDIQKYVTKAGDTLNTLAAKFGVTSDSISWSNNLTSNNLPENRELYIPPVNGIVYLVKAGDTPEKLARDYNAAKDTIIAFNDAEVSGLIVGQRIVIPGGTKGTSVYNVATSPRSGGGFAWGTSAVYGSSNGYIRGWCTWYVAENVDVPNNWGNANTWNTGARASGWTVSKTPRPGAIGQTTGPGLGHVALVEQVSPDSTMIKYSDMNGLAGWGHVGRTQDWVPASTFHNYIYR